MAAMLSWISFFHLCLLSLAIAEAVAVPTLFIFGDSTADVGTNNFLPLSKAKANFLYNGIDYPYSKPTGRFSNGFNTVDQIARLLGCKRSPPPFLNLLNHSSTFQKNILRGVNFASGGSGILDQTGVHNYTEVVPLKEQIGQFKTVQGNMTQLLGTTPTASLLSNSLFIISVGSNDIFEYQYQNSTISQQDLMLSLESNYQNYLETLYHLGARKFGIISVPPIGCCPFERALNKKAGGCVEELNDFAKLFYFRMEELLHKLSLQLKGMKYSLGNTYKMTIYFMEDPYAFGFKDIESACCGNGSFNGEVPCYLMGDSYSKLCGNRKEYLFWDRFHPTQAAAELAARTLFGGGPQFVTPINFKQLVEDSHV